MSRRRQIPGQLSLLDELRSERHPNSFPHHAVTEWVQPVLDLDGLGAESEEGR